MDLALREPAFVKRVIRNALRPDHQHKTDQCKKNQTENNCPRKERCEPQRGCLEGRQLDEVADSHEIIRLKGGKKASHICILYDTYCMML